MQNPKVNYFTVASDDIVVTQDTLLDRIKKNAIDHYMCCGLADSYRAQSPSEFFSSPFNGIADIKHYIDASAENVDIIGNGILGYAAGKNIEMARAELNALSSDMQKMSRSLELFSSPSCKIEDYISKGFRADDPFLLDTFDATLAGFMTVKEKTDSLVKTAQDYIGARDYMTESLNMCYEPFSRLKEESATRAMSTYQGLKTLQANYDIDNKIETNALTVLEDNSDSEMVFAQEVAKDKTIDEEELKEYLFLKALQMLEFEEDKLQWMEQKWRNRTDNIHEFIELCMRLCNKKIHSWTKSIALIYYYLVDKDVASPKRRYYILYMQNEFPRSESQDIRSIANHFSVTDEEKKEYFPQFDVCFTIAMNKNISTLAS